MTVPPMDGWSAAITTAAPQGQVVGADGQPVSEVASRITFSANGSGIAPGQSAEFVIDAGRLPVVDRLTFKVLQTYSDGSMVSWIEESAEGAPEPEFPAPVLTLAAGTATASPMSRAPSMSAVAGSAAEPAGALSAALTSATSAAGSGPSVSSASPALSSSSTAAGSNTGPIVLVTVLIAAMAAAVIGLVLARRRRSGL